MNRVLVLALLLTALGASPAPQPPPTATPQVSTTASPTPNPAVLTRAKDWYHRLQTNTLDRSQIDATMLAKMDDATLKNVAAQIAPLGDPVSFDQERTGVEQGNTYYIYKLTFKNGVKMHYLFVLDAQGKISGLSLAPITQ